MTPIEMRARRGVTLVELLVVMALIAALSALALMIAPGIANQDNTLKGTADVQAALRISQGMAAAAKTPRGVRLLSPSLAPDATPTIVTELQYLEAPPVLVPTPTVMVGDPYAPTVTAGDKQDAWRPQVEFAYSLDKTGTVINRTCTIIGLTQDQADQVVTGATIVLPTLNYFAQVTGSYTKVASSPLTVTVPLAVYPDSALGASGFPGTNTPVYQTFYFGIYGPPRPLLGEPTIQLPLNIGIDLALCQPIGIPNTITNTSNTYDIMFAPSGQRIGSQSVPGSSSQVFLWVRDYTKVAPMTPTAPSTYSSYAVAPPYSWIFTQNQFLLGGEQQVVGIRAAAIGSAPVLWPSFVGGIGTYAQPPSQQDPFTFARDKLTGQ